MELRSGHSLFTTRSTNQNEMQTNCFLFFAILNCIVFASCRTPVEDIVTEMTLHDMDDWNVTLTPTEVTGQDGIIDMETNKAIHKVHPKKTMERIKFAVENEVIVGKYVSTRVKYKKERSAEKYLARRKARDLGLFPFSMFNNNVSDTSSQNSVRCEETFIGEEGMLISPVFPPNKTEGRECTWRIGLSNLGSHITLTFPVFKLRSGYDCKDEYIEVWNGENQELLGCYCGNMLPRRLTSPSDKMIVRFVSNTNEQKLEFVGRFFKSSCGEIIQMEEGMIESPNFVFTDSPTRECLWEITVPQNFQVALKFQTMTVDPDYDCKVEYLEIWDSLKSTRLSCICGNTPHDQITTTSNKMGLRFVSRGPKQRMRFSAAFWSEGKPLNVMEEYRPHQNAPSHERGYLAEEEDEEDDFEENVEEPEFKRSVKT